MLKDGANMVDVDKSYWTLLRAGFLVPKKLSLLAYNPIYTVLEVIDPNSSKDCLRVLTTVLEDLLLDIHFKRLVFDVPIRDHMNKGALFAICRTIVFQQYLDVHGGNNQSNTLAKTSAAVIETLCLYPEAVPLLETDDELEAVYKNIMRQQARAIPHPLIPLEFSHYQLVGLKTVAFDPT